jgi:hypothetical protein
LWDLSTSTKPKKEEIGKDTKFGVDIILQNSVINIILQNWFLVDPIIHVLNFDEENKEDNSLIFNKTKYGHKGEGVKSLFASRPHRPQQSPINAI